VDLWTAAARDAPTLKIPRPNCGATGSTALAHAVTLLEEQSSICFSEERASARAIMRTRASRG
jgi:hypothetical protein